MFWSSQSDLGGRVVVASDEFEFIHINQNRVPGFERKKAHPVKGELRHVICNSHPGMV